ncbi:UDP-N-acetylglucosamine transferase subunit alg14 [Erysiphe neolycopersici]|uniref:UDP-N-acetylglucosamine transferase subunit ALG14 n=1 Tax=Erysiphe neolycopersici TaxID=212602 RepID=A0A420HWD4_9PEZI|nr:UDP-N-acetylglucosamine transferase subunit alg14 [Erysiphe neolycopersici]
MTKILGFLRDNSVTLFCSLLAIFFLRLIYINGPSKPTRKTPKGYHHRHHIVAILGSGGHSTEMISLLRDIDPTHYVHRSYIASSGDNFAFERAFQLEEVIQAKLKPYGPIANTRNWDPITGIWDVRIVPRARKIHQSLYTIPFSSLWCIFESIRTLYVIAKCSKVAPGEFPDVIVANGPGTALIVILASYVIRFLGISPMWKMKVIYVESWARVKSLSLSGRLLLKLGLCDRFLVQWETLALNINKKSTRKVEWAGILLE